jgi:polar amino acid transport system substrate-binding protein
MLFFPDYLFWPENRMAWTRRRALAAAISATIATRFAGAQTQPAAGVLCPTGKLRAALIRSNPVLVTPRADGTLGGVSVAVARALADHLAVPAELKPYDNPARYNESLESDEWDVGLAARDPLRADNLAFSVTFMEVDNGYVARAGAAPASADDVDRPGVRIAVAQGSAPHTVLRRLIKQAEIVPIPGGFEPARAALANAEADVYGENLHLAYRISDAVPGAHVLPGRFNVVQMAIGVRKRAEAALPAVDDFVKKIRADGVVQNAITEARLKGVRVP